MPATAIGFGPWAEVGLAHQARQKRTLDPTAWYAQLTPRRGLQLIDEALTADLVHVGAFDPDWGKFLRVVPRADRLPFFADMLRAHAAAGSDGGAGAEASSALRQALRTAAPEERAVMLERYVRDQVARVVGMPAGRVDPEASLKRMGIDSLMALELKNRFEVDLGVPLPTVDLLRGPSVLEICARIARQLDGAGEPPPSVAPADVTDLSAADAQRLLDDVEELSSEQVNALLAVLDKSDAPS